MRVRRQAGRVPLLTLVEVWYQSHHAPQIRWIVLDDHGHQFQSNFHSLDQAVEFAVGQTLAWQLWAEEDNTFCR